MRDELVMVVPRDALFPEGHHAFQGFAAGDESYLQAALGEYLFMPRRRAETDERYKQVIPYIVIQAAPGADCRFGYLFFQRTSGGDPRLGRLYSIGLGGHVNSSDVQVPPLVSRGRPKATGTGGAASTAPEGAGLPPSLVARQPGQPEQVRASLTSRSPSRRSGRPRRRLVRRVLLEPALKTSLAARHGPRVEDSPLFRGLRRELREEVVIPPGCTLRYLGAINDDSNSVGRVHLGLAFVLEVPSRPQWSGRLRSRRPARALASRIGGSPPGWYKVYLRREPGSVQVGALFGLDDILGYRQALESWSALLLDAGLLPVRTTPSS